MGRWIVRSHSRGVFFLAAFKFRWGDLTRKLQGPTRSSKAQKRGCPSRTPAPTRISPNITRRHSTMLQFLQVFFPAHSTCPPSKKGSPCLVWRLAYAPAQRDNTLGALPYTSPALSAHKCVSRCEERTAQTIKYPAWHHSFLSHCRLPVPLVRVGDNPRGHGDSDIIEKVIDCSPGAGETKNEYTKYKKVFVEYTNCGF